MPDNTNSQNPSPLPFGSGTFGHASDACAPQQPPPGAPTAPPTTQTGKRIMQDVSERFA
ncbi:MAG: hypothetical protein WBD02_11175 [Acidimicrobiia bacterium]